MAIKFNLMGLTSEKELVEVSIPQEKPHVLLSFLEELSKLRQDLSLDLLKSSHFLVNMQQNLELSSHVERNNVIFVIRQN